MRDDKHLLVTFAVLGEYVQALRDEGEDLRNELANLRRELAGVRDLAERTTNKLNETMRDRDAIQAANVALNKRVRELEAQAHS